MRKRYTAAFKAQVVLELLKEERPDSVSQALRLPEAEQSLRLKTELALSLYAAYFTALFNSPLLDWFLKHVSTTFHGGYFAANKQYLIQLPIRLINFSDPADKASHDRMVVLVGQMLELHKHLQAATSEAERGVVQRQIEATDRQIDALVYAMYGLTEVEVAMVGGGGAQVE
jgi:hypothetical protein